MYIYVIINFDILIYYIENYNNFIENKLFL